MRRALAVVGAVLIVGATGFAGGWALRTMAAPVTTASTSKPTLVTLERGEVSSVVTLGVTVRWALTTMGPNTAQGVLTSVLSRSSVLNQGDTLYTVNLRPVVLAVGQVPMFRDIEQGVSGQDVAEVQGMLAHLGYEVGTYGTVGATTTRAIRAWQKDLGMEADGVVRAGDIIVAPSAPLRVAPDKSHRTGDRLSGGESIVQRFAKRPKTIMALSEAQAAMVPPGVRVTIKAPGGKTWVGESAAGTAAKDGTGVEVPILAKGGGPVCGEQCGDVAKATETTMLAQVYRVEPTSGLKVPITAIATDGGGRTSIQASTGKEFPVKVLASADGMAVVEGKGIKEGMTVVVPTSS